ncbi:recombinase family protein [Sphingomonas ginkgonis]|jgi:DNA invertase Pin-like site-specific DNA recombinase|uniref:Recombinase family protein n=1 Tax=Sphingomonas ginkgonis TaxID=2315330 RepID=A0A429V255_9SPHN|nr:recombinase family protein [Sphingomonas ginkgonis]RST26414.1 recombinase family protein [Sphingomonas ginkgonis]RZL75867.1 MAG: recombinase family protein [Sphingomonas sp.]
MLIGYARVSTPEQDLTPQLEALREAGCEKVFSDKASGAKANRSGLADALSHARSGDILVVWKLDRLGRTMKGLVDLAAELAERKVGLRSVTDGIDTAGTAGKLVFHIMAAMAEMERDLIRERTTAALLIAKRDGRVGGRKTVMTPKRLQAARKLLASGMTAREIAPTIGVSVATLYRHLPAPEQEAINAETDVVVSGS